MRCKVGGQITVELRSRIIKLKLNLIPPEFPVWTVCCTVPRCSITLCYGRPVPRHGEEGNATSISTVKQIHYRGRGEAECIKLSEFIFANSCSTSNLPIISFKNRDTGAFSMFHCGFLSVATARASNFEERSAILAQESVPKNLFL